MSDELLEFKLNFFEDEIKNLNKKVESIEINLNQKVESIEKNLIQKIQNIENKINIYIDIKKPKISLGFFIF